MNQADSEKNRSRAWLKGDKFNKFMTGRRWGWQKFIKRDDLLDPENGFLKQDTIVFEASLDVYLKKATKVISEPRKFEPKLYPIPPCQLESDFEFLYEKTNSGRYTNDNSCSNSDCLNIADIDFVLDSGAVHLYAHSQILAARSSVFFSMFSFAFKEARTLKLESRSEVSSRDLNSSRNMVTIDIADIDPKVFNEMLQFVYSGRIAWNSIEDDLCNRSKKRSPTVKPTNLFSMGQSGSVDQYKKRKTASMWQGDGEEEEDDDAFMISESSFVDQLMTRSLPTSQPNVSEVAPMDQEVENSSYELKHTISAQRREQEVLLLRFALSLYEEADKYELNRLRLITEHKISSILCDQINRINLLVRKGVQFLPKQRSVTFHDMSLKLGSTPYGSSSCFPQPKAGVASSSVTENEVMWSNGFLDVLSVADRHNSKKLKKLCFEALTSDVIAKRTKRILLQNKKMEDLDKSLITEMLQFVTVREVKVSDEEDAIVEFAQLSGVPECGREIEDKEEDLHPTLQLKDVTAMQECEMKSELVERGYSISGSRVRFLSLYCLFVIFFL